MRMIKLTLAHRLNIPVFLNPEAISYMYKDPDGHTCVNCSNSEEGPSFFVYETPEEIMALANSLP
jgi:hypothetical protein